MSSTRSRPTARNTRCLAASSLTPIAFPTSCNLRPSKKRSTIARRSFSRNRAIASSNFGSISAQLLSRSPSTSPPGPEACAIAAAFRSRALSRRSRRSAASAVTRVTFHSHAPSTTSLGRFPAFRARTRNTACVTSSARCASLTCRAAAEYTRPTYRPTTRANASCEPFSRYSRSSAMSSIGSPITPMCPPTGKREHRCEYFASLRARMSVGSELS